MKIKKSMDDQRDIRGRNKGWISHRFDMIHDGEIIAYLRIQEVKKELIPNLATYLCYVRGILHPKISEAPASLSYSVLSDNDLHFYKNKISEEDLVIYTKEHNDYIEAYSNPLVGFVDVDEGFRRQGIATQLYKECVKELKKTNQFLYADGSQSYDAEKLWNYFQKIGDVRKDKNRRFIYNI